MNELPPVEDGSLVTPLFDLKSLLPELVANQLSKNQLKEGLDDGSAREEVGEGKPYKAELRCAVEQHRAEYMDDWSRSSSFWRMDLCDQTKV